VSVLLRDDFEQRGLTMSRPPERLSPPAPVNELVEHFVRALDFLEEDGVAVHLCLGCDRWTGARTGRASIEGLLLGLSLRACDHMHQGGLLSLDVTGQAGRERS